MILLNENIEKDLERWDKLGYIIISASISTFDTDTIDDEYPVLSDQYMKSQDLVHGDMMGMDNGARTNKLKKLLKDSGYSFKKVWGVFEGESEDSFMIFPMKVKNGEIEMVDFQELYDFGQDIVKNYTQWSVHVHKPGSGNTVATNDNGYGEVDEYYNNVRPSDKDSFYSTRTVNPKKPSSVNHGFTSDWDDEKNDGSKHKLTDHDFENIYNNSK